MEALTVWKFNTVEGAGQALKKLESLSKQELVAIEDAAIVYWETGKKKPKTHQAQSLTGVGALGGAFWGMLFGLLFFIPFFGLAVGAATGALIGPKEPRPCSCSPLLPPWTRCRTPLRAQRWS
jgi:uncharacterized membrane protein